MLKMWTDPTDTPQNNPRQHRAHKAALLGLLTLTLLGCMSDDSARHNHDIVPDAKDSPKGEQNPQEGSPKPTDSPPAQPNGLGASPDQLALFAQPALKDGHFTIPMTFDGACTPKGADQVCERFRFGQDGTYINRQLKGSVAGTYTIKGHTLTATDGKRSRTYALSKDLMVMSGGFKASYQLKDTVAFDMGNQPKPPALVCHPDGSSFWHDRQTLQGTHSQCRLDPIKQELKHIVRGKAQGKDTVTVWTTTDGFKTLQKDSQNAGTLTTKLPTMPARAKNWSCLKTQNNQNVIGSIETWLSADKRIKLHCGDERTGESSTLGTLTRDGRTTLGRCTLVMGRQPGRCNVLALEFQPDGGGSAVEFIGEPAHAHAASNESNLYKLYMGRQIGPKTPPLLYIQH